MSEHPIYAILAELDIKYNPDVPFDRKEWQKQLMDEYNNSIGNLNEYDGYNCDVCHNKEFIEKIDENGYTVRKYCRCHKMRETLRRARRSGLGNILTDFTFDKFIVSEDWQKQNKEKAQAFCNDDGAKWFFIGGQVGCGKTHLCTAVCGHYIKAGKDVLYMLWNEEAKKLKALVTENTEYQRIIEKYKNAEVLYIDDFLKTKQGEEPTAGDINIAFEILNHRLYDRDKITIISSEKTLIDILGYDEATMSRVFQATGNYKINVDRDLKKNYRLRG